MLPTAAFAEAKLVVQHLTNTVLRNPLSSCSLLQEACNSFDKEEGYFFFSLLQQNKV